MGDISNLQTINSQHYLIFMYVQLLLNIQLYLYYFLINIAFEFPQK